MRFRLLFPLLGLSLGMALSLQAQPLTLPQALRTAWQQQALYTSQQLRTAIAEAQQQEARAGRLPQVTASAELRFNPILATSIVPNFADPTSAERRAVQFGTRWQASAGLTLTQSLFDAALRGRVRTTRLSQLAAENETARLRQQVYEDVTKAYYQVQLYDAQVAFAAADARRTEALLQQVDARFAEGRALPTDRANARIAHANARLALRQATSNAHLSRQYLLVQMGLDTTRATGLQLADSLNPHAPATPTAAQRPDLRAALLDQQQAEANLRTERQGYLPKLSLVAYLGSAGFAQDLSVFNFANNWFGTSYIGVQLSMPVFDGFARAKRVQTERLRTQIAQAEQRRIEQLAAYEVASATQQLGQAQEAVAVRRDNLAAATDARTVVQERLNAGRALATELLDAEAAQQNAQQQYLQALYDCLLAQLLLQRALGDVPTE